MANIWQRLRPPQRRGDDPFAGWEGRLSCCPLGQRLSPAPVGSGATFLSPIRAGSTPCAGWNDLVRSPSRAQAPGRRSRHNFRIVALRKPSGGMAQSPGRCLHFRSWRGDFLVRPTWAVLGEEATAIPTAGTRTGSEAGWEGKATFLSPDLEGRLSCQQRS